MKFFEIAENRLVESSPSAGRIVLATPPHDHDRTLLQEQFRLDDYDLASTLDADEVPRLEVSNGRLLLIWKMPESASVSDTVELGVSVTGICLIQDRLAFIRGTGDIPFTDREFRSVRDARDTMLALLLRTVRHFVDHLKVIRQISLDYQTLASSGLHLLESLLRTLGGAIVVNNNIRSLLGISESYALSNSSATSSY